MHPTHRRRDIERVAAENARLRAENELLRRKTEEEARQSAEVLSEISISGCSNNKCYLGGEKGWRGGEGGGGRR